MSALPSPLARLRESLPPPRPRDERPWLEEWQPAGGSGRLLGLTLALVSIVALADLLAGDSVVLVGLYSVGSLIAATALDARRTALVTAYALAVAIAIGMPSAIFLTADHVARLATVVVVGGVSIVFARLRVRSELARERAEHAERRSALLAEVGALVGASLDCDATLRAVAAALVPRIADLCTITLLEPDGTTRPVAFAHADPRKALLGWELERRYPSDSTAFGLEEAIWGGQSSLTDDVPESLLSFARDPIHLRLLRALRLRSSIVVPLRAHGATFGALALGTAESGRRYEESDLELARDLATRCALAVDNARRHRAAIDSEERFRLLVDGVEDYAIFSMDAGGHVSSWNAGAERVHGYAPDDVIGRHISLFYTPEEVEAGAPGAHLALAAEQGRCEEEGWRLRPDGSRFYANAVTTVLHDDAGHMRGYARVTRDVTERKKLDAQLAHQAFHDSMTGLPNRRLFLDRVDGALARSGRREGSVAVLFFDLDRFKAVNDNLGHAAGDELLLGVATRLRDAVRLEDTVARFGGDEFAVLCEDLVERGDAIMVAERIAGALAAPFDMDGRVASVSASVGVAFAGDRHTPDALLQSADAAMYAAKERGDGRPVVFEESMRARDDQRAATENGLRRALEREELRLVYQPLVDLRSGEAIGVEALVRWAHPERGLLRPAQFIEVADEPDLVAGLTEWVLREGCSQLARWSEEAPDRAPLTLTLAVNLSGRELPRPELPEVVARVVADTGVDPATLSLEVSERDLVAHTRSATALFALKGLGVRLAVDDFGTGYSSLSLLKRLSVDSVKIAAPFVEGLGRRADDSTLVAAMISMARSLGVTTVAEAVETPEQLEELRALGCDRAQGFLFARPVPAERLPDVLGESRERLAAAAA